MKHPHLRDCNKPGRETFRSSGWCFNCMMIDRALLAARNATQSHREKWYVAFFLQDSPEARNDKSISKVVKKKPEPDAHLMLSFFSLLNVLLNINVTCTLLVQEHSLCYMKPWRDFSSILSFSEETFHCNKILETLRLYLAMIIKSPNFSEDKKWFHHNHNYLVQKVLNH